MSPLRVRNCQGDDWWEKQHGSLVGHTYLENWVLSSTKYTNRSVHREGECCSTNTHKNVSAWQRTYSLTPASYAGEPKDTAVTTTTISLESNMPCISCLLTSLPPVALLKLPTASPIEGRMTFLLAISCLITWTAKSMGIAKEIPSHPVQIEDDKRSWMMSGVHHFFEWVLLLLYMRSWYHRA